MPTPTVHSCHGVWLVYTHRVGGGTVITRGCAPRHRLNVSNDFRGKENDNVIGARTSPRVCAYAPRRGENGTSKR